MKGWRGGWGRPRCRGCYRRGGLCVQRGGEGVVVVVVIIVVAAVCDLWGRVKAGLDVFEVLGYKGGEGGGICAEETLDLFYHCGEVEVAISFGEEVRVSLWCGACE